MTNVKKTPARQAVRRANIAINYMNNRIVKQEKEHKEKQLFYILSVFIRG